MSQCLISVPNYGTIYPMLFKATTDFTDLSACCNRGQGQILTTLSALMYELYQCHTQIINLYVSNIESRFYGLMLLLTCSSQSIYRPAALVPQWVTSQNIDKPKRWQTETSTNQKRRQTETSTTQNVDKPKRRQTETSTDRNVDNPKRRQTETSTDRNVDKPKRRHSKTTTQFLRYTAYNILSISMS